MPDISVKNIKGVGAKTTQYLDKLGIRTVPFKALSCKIFGV